MSKSCARCGKPVFFAERKTSLGREWHPSCLKCHECGKVLSPGQHAEHKGLPFCHNPCYKALFGPSILGYGSNISSPANFARKDRPASHGHDYGGSNGLNEIYSGHNNKHAAKASPPQPDNSRRQDNKVREILQKIEDFNKYNEGKVHHQMLAVERDDGSVHVEGPLRIYWGLNQPIQLVHCDNIPPAPIAQWRHSLYEGPGSPDTPDKRFSNTLVSNTPDKRFSNTLASNTPDKRFSNTLNLKVSSSPSGKSRELDDLLTPSSPDDVVRRKKGNVRKFKTVAYRGDQPTKWKRASINGHIFNYDTSVFTPVLGSCTSVTVDSSLTSAEVIETLLDKFKVQNNPDEYVLSIVSEEGERLLTNSDKPLLERLKLGPNETMGKIFIRERTLESGIGKINSSIKMPIAETAEENLPHEVEQLLVLPEAVLTGLLAKFKNDEEKEVQCIKTRYDIAKRKIQKVLAEVKNYQTSSSA